VAILSHNEGTRLVVGVGSRKGIDKAAVLQAIDAGLGEIDASIDDVKVVATAFVKSHEQGIIDAISELEKPIAFVPKSVINSSRSQTKSRAAIIGLAGVAEPCALALSSLKELVLTKKSYGGVTLPSRGRIQIIGIGPGSIEDMTVRAVNAIANSEYIVVLRLT